MSSDQNNQENLLKIVEDSQKNQRLTAIISGVNIFLTTITTILLMVKAFRQQKPSPNVQIIRKRGEISKEKLRNKVRITREKLRSETKLNRLNLELITLEKEMAYQANLSQWKSGLEKPTSKEINLESNKITSQVSEKTQQAHQAVNKGIDKIKEATEQIKGLKDKIFGSEKEK